MNRPIFPFEADLERRSFARVLAACSLSEYAASKQQRASPKQILRANWPDDDRAALLLKAAVSPADTTNTGLPPATTTAMWRTIAPGSAMWRLLDHPAALRLDMTGWTSINLPNPTNLPIPVFVEEGKPAPVVNWIYGNTVLGPTKKMLVLSAVTEELNQATPESAASIIGRVLSDATNKSIDVLGFDATAGSDIRPPGLLYGVNATAPSVATDPYIAMTKDLSALVQAIADAGIDPTDTVFIASAGQAMTVALLAGAKFNSDVLMSLGVPPKTVIAVSPAGIASGYQGPPVIETSFHPPVNFATPPGEPTGTPTYSSFQSAMISIKVRANAAWAAAPGAVQYMSNVLW